MRLSMRVYRLKWAAAIALVVSSTLAGAANAQQQQTCTLSMARAIDVATYIDTHQPYADHILAKYELDSSTDPDQLLGLPGQYMSKAGLIDDRVAAADIYVELFGTRADRAARLVTLQKSSQGTSPESSLAVDRLLLRLPSGFTPDAVAEYRGILNGLCAVSEAAAVREVMTSAEPGVAPWSVVAPDAQFTAVP